MEPEREPWRAVAMDQGPSLRNQRRQCIVYEFGRPFYLFLLATCMATVTMLAPNIHNYEAWSTDPNQDSDPINPKITGKYPASLR